VELFPRRRDKITAEPVKMQKKPDEPKKNNAGVFPGFTYK
jgi:hypothetical protein